MGWLVGAALPIWKANQVPLFSHVVGERRAGEHCLLCTRSWCCTVCTAPRPPVPIEPPTSSGVVYRQSDWGVGSGVGGGGRLIHWVVFGGPYLIPAFAWRPAAGSGRQGRCTCLRLMREAGLSSASI